MLRVCTRLLFVSLVGCAAAEDDEPQTTELAAEAEGSMAAVDGDSEHSAPLKGIGANYAAEMMNETTSASFGEADASKKVIGADSRAPVANTERAPYSTIVELTITFPKDPAEYLCTGSLIGPGAVLTAAHCVYNKGKGGYAKTTRVVPGTHPDANNVAQEPFGETSAVAGRVPDEYKTATDEWAAAPFDYGVLRLRQAIGAKAGTRQMGVMTNARVGQKVKLVAYHGDKWVTDTRGGTSYVMHMSEDQVRKTYDGLFNHYADSFEGASGGPIVGDDAFADTIFAIHVAGPEAKNGQMFNVGVLLDEAKLANIRRWSMP